MFNCSVTLVRSFPLLTVIAAGFIATSAHTQGGIESVYSEHGGVELRVNRPLSPDALSDIIGLFEEAGIEIEVQVSEEDRERMVAMATPVTESDFIQDYRLSDFSEFSTVAATAEFSTWDKVVWTNRQMFNTKAFDELVVLYGYHLATVCGRRPNEATAALAPHGGFLMWPAAPYSSSEAVVTLAYDERRYAAYEADVSEVRTSILEALGEASGIDPVAVAAVLSSQARNPLDPVCSRVLDAEHVPQTPAAIDQEQVASFKVVPSWWTPVDPGYAGAMLATDLYELSGERVAMLPSAPEAYLMTADRVPGLDPVTEIWARCNIREPDSLGSACQATLAESPYAIHHSVLGVINAHVEDVMEESFLR